MKASFSALALSLLLAAGASAQQATRTEPVTGLRDNGTGYHALVGARAVVSPGRTVDDATIVIRDGLIRSVEEGGTPPAGARVWNLTGHTVYPGFIDAHADLGMDDVPEGGDVGPTHWNPQVRAWFSTTANLRDDAERRRALRSQGFGTALVVPKQGIFRGTASVVDLGEAGVRDRVLRPDVAQSVGFDRSFELGGRYPNSSMGTIALMRQTFMDADWYQRAWAAYEAAGRTVLPPETSEALEALEDAVEARQPVLFETGSEEEYLRAQALAEEFGLDAWYRGSGQEYRIVDVLRESDAPLLVPLDFPDAPEVDDPEAALNASLAELRHWYLAPASPGRLAEAGIDFAITSDGLTSVSDFLPNLRTAVARGLSPEDALAALTTTPARWLGIDGTHGTIAEGKVANLVVAEGDLFTRESGIRDVWVRGVAHGVTRAAQIDPRGTWRIASDDAWGFEAELTLEGTLNRLGGYIDVAPGPDVGFQGVRVDIASASVVAETGRLEVRFPGEELGYEGTALLAGSIRGDDFYGWTALPNGANPSFAGTRTAAFEGEETGTVAAAVPELDLPFIRPMMEYGVSSLPEQPAAVIVRNATLWTQGPEGRLESADLLVRNGRIAEVGTELTAPRGAVEVDGTGKHVTPGLIDPHIHSGVSSVNETGATIVPEVRMGDVVTHNNIWMYRQLAGGLTTAMIKHGSANPIGGENVIVKMRWGGLPDELRLENRELLNELQQANGRSSSTALQQTRRVESLRETESYLRDQLERTRSELSETEQEALVTAFKYIWLNRVANETGEVDPDGDGVRSAVEVWYCYDPMNASETPPPGTDLSSDIESKCEESG